MKFPNKSHPVHGMYRTRIYRIWKGIKRRCLNPNNEYYKDYGGRGISVCKEWEDFKNFYNWAMNSGYSDTLTIDRINNDGNYDPDNCRWVTQKVQNNNTRKNHYLTYKGKTKSMAEWSEITGIPYSTLKGRINSLHWSVEKTIETPTREKRKG